MGGRCFETLQCIHDQWCRDLKQKAFNISDMASYTNFEAMLFSTSLNIMWEHRVIGTELSSRTSRKFQLKDFKLFASPVDTHGYETLSYPNGDSESGRVSMTAWGLYVRGLHAAGKPVTAFPASYPHSTAFNQVHIPLSSERHFRGPNRPAAQVVPPGRGSRVRHKLGQVAGTVWIHISLAPLSLPLVGGTHCPCHYKVFLNARWLVPNINFYKTSQLEAGKAGHAQLNKYSHQAPLAKHRIFGATGVAITLAWQASYHDVCLREGSWAGTWMLPCRDIRVLVETTKVMVDALSNCIVTHTCIKELAGTHCPT
eukprot:155535-Pelagomonas_calceolata.AAC.3